MGIHQYINANSAYEHSHLVARDLMDKVSELLSDMLPPDNDVREINWEDVGTVNEVNSKLIELIEFLGGSK